MDHPRVLVVDDDADVGEFLRDALSSWNYDVTSVASGREAVDLISRQIFDAALVDIWMPEMDGLQVLDEMKRHDAALEVVMMTGNPMVETAVQALKSSSLTCGSRFTKATIDWPVVSSDWGTTADSATCSWETRADSTSIVERRWPETLITSSVRPTIQK